MNRRECLLALGSLPLTCVTGMSNIKSDPIVVRWSLEKDKLHTIHLGHQSINSYRSDTLTMHLDNGRILESWIDNNGMINTGGSHLYYSSRQYKNNPYSVHGVGCDYDVAESFGKTYFWWGRPKQ